MKKKKIFLGIGIALLTILVLWFSGLLPKQVAKVVATCYINKQENPLTYELESIKYSPFHDSYFVGFSLNGDMKEGKTLDIPYKYFPFIVLSGTKECEQYDNE